MEDHYHDLGMFYDEIVGDRKDAIRLLLGLLKEHAPKAKKVLEIACGTGTILKALSKKYDLVGLDASETMLSRANEKCPEVPLFKGDMRNFSTGEIYDVVICMFDSINHLTRLSDWKKTFKTVRARLDKGGTFIFDVNTLYKLEKLSSDPPIVHEFNDHTLILGVQKQSAHRFDWASRVFAPVSDELFTCVDQIIPESAYSVGVIKEQLDGLFKVKKIIDFEGNRRTAKSERLCFVCEAI